MDKREIMYIANIQLNEDEILPKLIEEMAELTQMVTKFMVGDIRIDSMAGEAADVRIMLDQFMLMVEEEYPGFIDLIDKKERQKIDRQFERIKEKLCAQQRHTSTGTSD